MSEYGQWRDRPLRYAVYPKDWILSRDGIPEEDFRTRHEAIGQAAILSRDSDREFEAVAYPPMTLLSEDRRPTIDH